MLEITNELRMTKQGVGPSSSTELKEIHVSNTAASQAAH